jgi:hypothetical protein
LLNSINNADSRNAALVSSASPLRNNRYSNNEAVSEVEEDGKYDDDKEDSNNG